MIKIAKSCLVCPYAVFFDTYSGCSHSCSYCFVKNYRDINDIKVDTTPKSVLDFINGKRNTITNWVRKDFPLRWGVLSDPFQPVEKIKKVSYEILKVFAKTGYPFIVTTKSSLIRNKEYKDVLRDCNFILQVSCITENVTNKFETGIRNFNERLEMLNDYRDIAFKTVVRCCPYRIEYADDVIDLIPKYADVGVKLFQVNSFFSNTKFPNSIFNRGNYEYDPNFIKPFLVKLKNKCHESNLVFGCTDRCGISDTVGCCVGEDYGIFAGNKACELYLKREGGKLFEFEEILYEEGTAQFYHEIKRGGVFSRKNLSHYNYAQMFMYHFNFNRRL